MTRPIYDSGPWNGILTAQLRCNFDQFSAGKRLEISSYLSFSYWNQMFVNILFETINIVHDQFPGASCSKYS